MRSRRTGFVAVRGVRAASLVHRRKKRAFANFLSEGLLSDARVSTMGIISGIQCNQNSLAHNLGLWQDDERASMFPQLFAEKAGGFDFN
jgi:hypothetical protein